MRVTITSRIFSPEPAAASYRLGALADALDEAGHTVMVLTTAVPGGAASGTRVGVRVKRFPVLRDAAGYVRGYLQYMSFDIPLFFRLLVGRRRDVIVTEPPPTTGFVVRIAAAIRRTPYVYYAADIWSDATESTGAPGLVIRVVRGLERFTLRGARAVIAVTDGVAERVRELSGHDRVTVVRNGIDTLVFTSDGERDETVPFAIYAGTTSEWQGADIFVRAMPAVLKRVPNARLIFIGQGTGRPELERLTTELGLESVEFLGVLAPTDTARWIRSAHAGLVSLKPGQGYDFAVPTKILAAAACGTQVIYAGIGPSVDLVRDGRLGLAVAYETGAVAAALADALSMPVSEAARKRLSQWARDNASLESTGRASSTVVESAVRVPRND